MMIVDEIEVGQEILASGGYADIRSGTHLGRLVALKALRVAALDDHQKLRKVSTDNAISDNLHMNLTVLLQQFCKEVVLWSTLFHPHVLKLIGVYGDMEKGQFITVSEWMVHGNIMEYIKKNSANRLEVVCNFILSPLRLLRYKNSCTGQLRA